MPRKGWMSCSCPDNWQNWDTEPGKNLGKTGLLVLFLGCWRRCGGWKNVQSWKTANSPNSSALHISSSSCHMNLANQRRQQGILCCLLLPVSLNKCVFWLRTCQMALSSLIQPFFASGLPLLFVFTTLFACRQIALLLSPW